ncbi:tripartite-type tricarboxylate transporter receptor subunit TctC [Caldalkalibacillus uzonensis]|uniref:Tripartite-type tricarboxylate transporter receptor subunit TctC n=1 Tax=Caldalkalibacillus uzonensis TaxID=353224 RepID=A0ABU0CPG7_9BACI|nr:tripartite tricarboxylate transporter substrate binding protein [Caldalkalibacillus uzonensis]MDQ0337983.1 tripartite-type tricarboxylate transporter receptor subunit TctC [Caldalkalibacillus uzonensis]
MKKLILFVLLSTCLMVNLTGCTRETDVEAYPNKPIQLIVSYSAGAATDTQARIVAKYASQYLGQELVIVNRPGGGGQVGWNYFASVEPDGYILTAYNLPHIITQPMIGETSFQLDTFEPIVNWGWDPTVFAVRHDSPYQTLDALLEAVRQSPGTITIGHAGKFVGQHLAILLLEQEAAIHFEDVAYNGAADALAALLGGHIQVVAGNLSDMYRQGDEVRILAIATEERHPYAPDVPTFTELGYPSVKMSTDRGIAAKAGTPAEVINRLEESFLQLLHDEDFQEEMAQAGADLLIMNRNDLLQEFKQRQALYTDLLEGITTR